MLGNLTVAPTLKRGSPMASPNKLIAIYGPSGCGKTTEIVKYLTASGKSSVIVDIDGNSGPIIAAPPQVLERMNYLKLRNSLQHLHAMDFVNRSMTDPQLKLCQEHGYLDCGLCKNSGSPSIMVNFDDLRNYDVLVIDSASLFINAIKLFSIKEAGLDKDLRKIWQRVSLNAATFLHFMREIHETVIVLSHPLDIRLEVEKAVHKQGPNKGEERVQAYYKPRFGSVPFSKEVSGSLTEVIYMNEDGGIITNAKRPYFANTRVPIKSTTVHGALLEIIDGKVL